MFLIRRVLQLQLTYALNAVNNEGHKYKALINGVGQLLDEAHEDTAALVQLNLELIMVRL